MVKIMRTNWREIRRAIREESEKEDCMIPARERGFVKSKKR